PISKQLNRSVRNQPVKRSISSRQWMAHVQAFTTQTCMTWLQCQLTKWKRWHTMKVFHVTTCKLQFSKSLRTFHRSVNSVATPLTAKAGACTPTYCQKNMASTKTHTQILA